MGLISIRRSFARSFRSIRHEWLEEVASIRTHYAKFGERFPRALMDELDALDGPRLAACLNRLGLKLFIR